MAKILAVDDDADIRMVLKLALEMAGHQPVVASGGAEALRKLKRTPFDLVLLDVMMPEMDGYQVLTAIRKMPSRAHTPVIVITAKHDPVGLLNEMKQGVVDHLVKPFLPTELAAVVERALSGSAAERAERRRMLEHDADVYGSIGELFDDVRSNPDDS